MIGGDQIKRRLKMVARGLSNVVKRDEARRPCSRILTYHSVGRRDHEMNVTPEDFRAQMRWLADHAEVPGLNEAVKGNGGIAITFDDG